MYVLVWPMRTLAVAIRSNCWSESSSLRPSVDGIEPWVDPFTRSGRLSRRRIRQMAHRNRENSGESQWTLSVSSSPGHHAGASHAPGAAATSISAPMRRHHSPAGGFPVQDAGRARVARQASPDEFVHVMQLTSKKR
jgi:hypothetical protein